VAMASVPCPPSGTAERARFSLVILAPVIHPGLFSVCSCIRPASAHLILRWRKQKVTEQLKGAGLSENPARQLYSALSRAIFTARLLLRSCRPTATGQGGSGGPRHAQSSPCLSCGRAGGWKEGWRGAAVLSITSESRGRGCLGAVNWARPSVLLLNGPSSLPRVYASAPGLLSRFSCPPALLADPADATGERKPPASLGRRLVP